MLARVAVRVVAVALGAATFTAITWVVPIWLHTPAPLPPANWTGWHPPPGVAPNSHG